MRRIFSAGLGAAKRTVTTRELKNAYETAQKIKYFTLTTIFGIGFGYSALTWYYHEEDAKKIILNPQTADELRYEQMKSRFDAFADVVSGDTKSMSYKSFVDSILNREPTGKDAKIPEELDFMFNLADTNGDRLISFKEYSFFVSLLSSNARELKTNFMMMDSDGSGNLDLSEFIAILKSQPVDPEFFHNISNLPLVKMFFGEDGKQSLSFEAYLKFIHRLEKALLKCEFAQFDKGNGKISVQDFINIIHKSVYYNKRLNPDFQEQVLNLQKEHYFTEIDFNTYRDFYVLSKHIDDIDLAIEYYTVLDIPMTKENFHKALVKITKVPFSMRVVDLIFAMFGQDAVTKELKKGTSFIGYQLAEKSE